jgi:hypothetical protein
LDNGDHQRHQNARKHDVGEKFGTLGHADKPRSAAKNQAKRYQRSRPCFEHQGGGKENNEYRRRFS